MIRAHFGLDQNPFSLDKIALLSHQQEVFDTLRVHCQQGGLEDAPSIGYSRSISGKHPRELWTEPGFHDRAELPVEILPAP